MVQFTREICNCNQNCVADSFVNVPISYICHDLDTDNLFISQKHTFCSNYKLRISDGDMFTNINFHSNQNLGLRIEKSMRKLCDDDQKYYNQLQCAMYELKEECDFDTNCYEKFIQQTSAEGCINPNYVDQIKDIEKSVELDEINVKLLYSEPDGPARNIRSLMNFNESYYNMLEYKDPSTSLPIIESENSVNVIYPYGYLIGFTIFSSLGFFIYKLYKKVSSKSKTVLLQNSKDNV